MARKNAFDGFVLFLIAVGASGCHGSAPQGDPMEPTGTPWSDQEAWQIEEDFRLGTSDEAGPELFGEIRAIAVDGEGTMVVFDGLGRVHAMRGRRASVMRAKWMKAVNITSSLS